MTDRIAAVALLALPGCHPQARQPSPSVETVWEQPRAIVAGGVIRLPGGECLDAHLLPPPWHLDAKSASQSTMLAKDTALGVRQTAYDWYGGGGPGTLSVDYGAWILPPAGRNGGSWPIAAPNRLRALIRTKQLGPVRFPGQTGSLSVFRMGDQSLYADARLLTQCVESGSTIQCRAVANRRDWSFGFVVDSGQAAKLPGLLARIEQAVEAIRHACPAVPNPT